MTCAASPHPRAANGAVVKIIGARSGSAERTIGGCVNVALPHFTKAMADSAIRPAEGVKASNPGLIETDRIAGTIERTMQGHSLSRDDARAYLLAWPKTTRPGHPDKIGALTVFHASSKAGCMQRAVSDIDGGAT